MSNPLKELRRLLNVPASTGTGEVVSVTGGIRVSMLSGVHTVTSITPVSVGDTVLVVNGVIQGKVRPPSELPTYYL